jgi:hypothetical protein
MSELTNVLKEAAGDVLTDETLNQIERVFTEAVDSKVAIHVEKALTEQDESHAKKLTELLEAIDTDHTRKLEKVVESIDKNHSQKLVQLVKRYENSINEEANQFKQSLVESISTYIEEYIDEKIPVENIQEAVKNKKAIAVLENLRSTLGIDFALSKETIKDAITEGKQQLDKSSNEIKTLVEQNNALSHQVQQLNSHILLSEKTQELPVDKRNYLFKVLKDKPVEFINENFDYTLKLFDRSEADRLSEYKKDAMKSRPTEVDRPIVEKTQSKNTQPVQESLNPLAGTYMSELGKY